MRVQLRFAFIFLVGLWGDNGVALGASTEEIVAMEIRSALNYQTGVVQTSIDKLTQAFRAVQTEASATTISQLSEAIRAVGALTKDVSETTSKIRQMEARVTSIESDLIKLGLLRNELQLTKSQLQDVEARVERNEMKNGIYFDAYRSTPFGRTGNLTFSELTESGNSGMDISSGIFTARTDGVYAFSFHANTVKGDDNLVVIRRNGFTVAGAFDSDNYKYNTVSQMVLMELGTGDKVWVEIVSGGARSNENIYVHFVGYLLSHK